MMVLDASVVVDLLLRANADALEERLLAPQESWHAPYLLDLEVASALRRHTLAGAINHARGRQALIDFADMGITRYAHLDLLPRIWQLRGSVTAYDGAYVALAEALEAPLLTRDRRLAQSSGHRAEIQLV